MSYKDIFDEIKSGKRAPVYIFTGKEEYIKARAIQALSASLVDALPELNYRILGEDCTTEDIVQELDKPPVLSTGRLVEVRDMKALLSRKKNQPEDGEEAGAAVSPDVEPFAQALSRVPQDVCLVFSFHEGAVPGGKLWTAVKKHGKAVDFDLLTKEEALPFIVRMAKNWGCAIGRNEAGFVYDFVGADMSRLENEMEKLCSFAGQGGQISRELVTQMATQSVEWKIFNIIESLFNRRKAEALENLSGILNAGESPIMVMALMERQVRIMAAVANQPRTKYPQIAQSLGVKPFALDRAVRQSRDWDIQRLHSFISECARLDTAVKRGEKDEKTALDLLVMKAMESAV